MSGPTELGWQPATDPAAWNRYVEQAPGRAFPQLWEWGTLREGRGWSVNRLTVGSADAPRAAAQILVRRLPLAGWGLGYLPRGPIGDLDDPAVRQAIEQALREIAGRERIAVLRGDPEVTADSPFGAALMARPWRPAEKVMPLVTRLIDLRRTEDVLRGDLRKKHRQYVAKAERDGVTIQSLPSETEPAQMDQALTDFYRIYRATALRAGFGFRVEAYYRRVWQAMAAGGRAHLFFAAIDGQRVATLFHLRCGDRVAEVYGGMLPSAAESRANYLLKWEAIRAFQAQGLAVYDLWGLATGGIRQFKEGFGGTEVTYVGARELVTSSLGAAAIRPAMAAYGAVQRLRARRDQMGSAAI